MPMEQRQARRNSNGSRDIEFHRRRAKGSKEDATMTDRQTARLYTALDEDAQLAAAIQRLPAAARTDGRLMAERAVRAAAIAVTCRALGSALRGPLSWPRAARMSRPTIPAAPGA
jgi:hypothetical protein